LFLTFYLLKIEYFHLPNVYNYRNNSGIGTTRQHNKQCYSPK
jgi:hypothetical protein